MKKRICQSCGMPIDRPELCGTDSHGMRIADYCVYCYKNGGFTSDVTMEEMLRVCASYVEGKPVVCTSPICGRSIRT